MSALEKAVERHAKDCIYHSKDWMCSCEQIEAAEELADLVEQIRQHHIVLNERKETIAQLRADLTAAQKQVKALLKLFPSVEAMCEFEEMKVNWSDNTIAVIKEATTWLEEDK